MTRPESRSISSTVRDFSHGGVRFGSVAASQHCISERLLSGVYQPLTRGLSKVEVLSVCFHQYQPLSAGVVGGCLRPEADELSGYGSHP